jgi:HEAT repeat protein
MRRTLVLALFAGLLAGCDKPPADPAALVQQLREGTAEQRDQAVEALTQLGKEIAPVLPEIEKAVLDKDPEVRRAAVKTLAAYGADAKSGLIVALGDQEADIRALAAETLGKLGVEAAKTIPNLAERLGDPDFKVAAAARRALVQIGDEARPALARIVVSGNDDARDNALRGLVEIGEASIPDLVEAAKAHEAGVRRAVLESLIVMKPPPIVVLETYRRALADKDTSVRDVAARAIQNLGESAADAAPDLIPLLADKDNAGPAEWALRDIGAAAVPSLSKALTHRKADVRARAAHCLSTMEDHAKAAVPDLIAALDDADASVRREVIATLSTLGPPEEAVAALAAHLGDEDERCVHRITVALERVPELARGALSEIVTAGKEPAAGRAKTLLEKLPAAGEPAEPGAAPTGEPQPEPAP